MKLLLSAVAAASLSSCCATVVVADNCDAFEQLAHRAATLRQQGVKIDHEPRNRMEQEMLTNVFQIPGYFGHQAQEVAIDRFTADWARACRSGWYNF